MSSNRLIYDNCAYEQKLNQSTAPGNYSMYPGKYENSSPCRIQLGQVGGNGVSLYTGNMVDLESDLFGIDRQASLCNAKEFKPSCTYPECGTSGLPCDSLECRSRNLVNQPSCQMIDYKPVVEAPPFEHKACEYDSTKLYSAGGGLVDRIMGWFR
jgi:hypothetical protein